MARTKPLSPDAHAELSAELERLLDERDDMESHARAVRKAFRGELEVIADSIARTRLRLKGATGLQTEIPGTEVGQRKRNPAVLEILAAAKRVRAAAEDMEADTEADIHVGTDGREGATRASGAFIHPDKIVGTREEAVERHQRGPGRPKKPKHAAHPEAEE